MKRISVIIPAYNAEKLIRKAIESAIQFEEVGEVIVVEDGSADGTLEICKQIENEFEKVKLYTHPGNINKGAGASRNLGIKNSNFEYVAFIDADDYFLPNRFEAEKKILFNGEKNDGVYGAIGTVYYSEEANKIFQESLQPELLTVKKHISPEDLKYALLGMSKDYYGSAFFSLDALTVKKSLIEKAGFFNEKLRLHQDTDLIIKMAFIGKLAPGIIDKPIGMRGIHGKNRITSKDYGYKSRYVQFSELENWVNENIREEEKVKRYIRKVKIIYEEVSLKDTDTSKIKRFKNLIKKEPYLLYLEKDFELLIKGMFGDNFLTKVVNKSKVILFRLIYPVRLEHWYQYFYQ